MVRRVAVMVGSLRKESLNRKAANAFASLAPTSLTCHVVDIGQLPFYNQDLEDRGDPAPEWVAFRELVMAFDAILLVTPEYNRSVPAVLKNALDVGSRPYGHSVWNGKPGAVMSVSQGAMGAFGANHHLRQCLTTLNMPCMQQPEAYVGGAARLFDDRGRLADEPARSFFVGFMTAYAAWIESNVPRI